MGRPIGKRIEDAIIARLSDDTYGLNVWLEQVAPDYGLDASELTFDFGEDSTQFFVGITSTSDVLADEDVTFPTLSLTINRSVNENKTQGPTGVFSGTVLATLQIEIDWEQENAKARTSDRANCYEEALYACFCNFERTYRWVPGNGIVFARDLAVNRGPLRQGAKNLAQLLTVQMPFELEAR